jgi:hypothetical protein
VVECDKARKSFAIYYMPHNARLTATRVAHNTSWATCSGLISSDRSIGGQC